MGRYRFLIKGVGNDQGKAIWICCRKGLAWNFGSSLSHAFLARSCRLTQKERKCFVSRVESDARLGFAGLDQKDRRRICCLYSNFLGNKIHAGRKQEKGTNFFLPIMRDHNRPAPRLPLFWLTIQRIVSPTTNVGFFVLSFTTIKATTPETTVQTSSVSLHCIPPSLSMLRIEPCPLQSEKRALGAILMRQECWYVIL